MKALMEQYIGSNHSGCPLVAKLVAIIDWPAGISRRFLMILYIMLIETANNGYLPVNPALFEPVWHSFVANLETNLDSLNYQKIPFLEQKRYLYLIITGICYTK